MLQLRTAEHLWWVFSWTVSTKPLVSWGRWNQRVIKDASTDIVRWDQEPEACASHLRCLPLSFPSLLISLIFFFCGWCSPSMKQVSCFSWWYSMRSGLSLPHLWGMTGVSSHHLHQLLGRPFHFRGQSYYCGRTSTDKSRKLVLPLYSTPRFYLCLIYIFFFSLSLVLPNPSMFHTEWKDPNKIWIYA